MVIYDPEHGFRGALTVEPRDSEPVRGAGARGNADVIERSDRRRSLLATIVVAVAVLSAGCATSNGPGSPTTAETTVPTAGVDPMPSVLGFELLRRTQDPAKLVLATASSSGACPQVIDDIVVESESTLAVTTVVNPDPDFGTCTDGVLARQVLSLPAGVAPAGPLTVTVDGTTVAVPAWQPTDSSRVDRSGGEARTPPAVNWYSVFCPGPCTDYNDAGFDWEQKDFYLEWYGALPPNGTVEQVRAGFEAEGWTMTIHQCSLTQDLAMAELEVAWPTLETDGVRMTRFGPGCIGVVFAFDGDHEDPEIRAKVRAAFPDTLVEFEDRGVAEPLSAVTTTTSG